MPIAAWPSTLPYKPERGSFARGEHHRPARRAEVEDGPDIQGVSSQTKIKKFRYGMIFTAAEYATWETFAETTLVQGTAHFTMLVPLVGATYVSRRCYLDGAQWSDQELGGPMYSVDFTLCVFVAPLT